QGISVGRSKYPDITHQRHVFETAPSSPQLRILSCPADQDHQLPSNFHRSGFGNVVIGNSSILKTKENKKRRTSGTPGPPDLETIKRLSFCQENYLLERMFFGQEQESHRESIISLGTYSYFSEVTGFSGMSFSHLLSNLSEKFQGQGPSLTSGILDIQPGVVTKDLWKLDADLDQMTILNNFEDDYMVDNRKKHRFFLCIGDYIALLSLASSRPIQHPDS
ncbi:hypothetical protein HPG69_019629, partial [Diceros bicornis minor]